MKIETELTSRLGCQFPIIVAPMFLVSNVAMVVAGSEAGAIGSFPALNARPVAQLREWLHEIKSATQNPYAVNLIVNRSNPYLEQQMTICLEARVPMIIASLGDPAELIRRAHAVGTQVYCDVIEEKHAEKAVAAGADGLIAVTAGAGGHGGNISALVWIPYLKKRFPGVPIIAAGGIADGRGLAAALALGAAGVSIGTRFIASEECRVAQSYKDAVVNSNPHDIVTTYKLDGVAANVINTPYIKRRGTQLNVLERILFRNRQLRKLLMGMRALRSIPLLDQAAQGSTWKELWGAGQVAGLIDEVLPIVEIVNRIVAEYVQVREHLP